MIRSLTIAEVLEIYQRIMKQTGGLVAIRDFGGSELYPSIAEKAAALGFSLIQNHPFADGNKRTGHAATAMFLAINGYKIDASIDEQTEIILSVAAGKLSRENFAEWLSNAIQVFL
ncbi:MAG: hypothetical protein CNIPEHKO_00874 [Anaerolineales bacterium]|nr:hypothetical protein [Anaerolineales bacterium]